MLKRLDRYDLAALLLLTAIVSTMFSPLLAQLIRGTRRTIPATDYPAHSAFAAQMRDERRAVLPHPLYHLTLIGVQKFQEISRHKKSDRPTPQTVIAAVESNGQGVEFAVVNQYYSSAAISTTKFYLWLLACVLWLQFRRAGVVANWQGMLGCVALVVGLMIAAPVAILAAIDDRFYYGYIGINVWHGPTALVAKPFAVMAFLCSLWIFAGDRPGSRLRDALLIGLIVFLSALAKPSYLMALIPAVMLLTLWQVIARKSVRWSLVAALVVPAVMMLAWQYSVAGAMPGGRSGMAFAPLSAMGKLSEDLPIKFLASIIFPAGCYLMFFREAVRSLRLNLAWLIFFVGAGFTYLLVETKNPAHGNFSWSAQLALFVLFVESSFFLLTKARYSLEEPARLQSVVARLAICALFLGAHVAVGAQYYCRILLTPQTMAVPYR